MEMAMVDIVHRVGIKAPVSAVYAALATIDGLAGWWTRETTGRSQAGGRITFRFRDPAGREVGVFVMEVLSLTPERAVRWQVQEGPPEWVGTEIEFLLTSEGEHSIVRFGHRGWREEVEFTAHCSMKWATFLLSLRQLVETGRGQPAPDDLKIDNWN
ncbi:SRPBCC family protein [Rhizobacter sp. LjRoot28]|uniref:SRPBCC family protein n=1 Tax=Rhizobacter sp. LjRoot28 TaxID=3342309 RepID=UPI003ED119C9